MKEPLKAFDVVIMLLGAAVLVFFVTIVGAGVHNLWLWLT